MQTPTAKDFNEDLVVIRKSQAADQAAPRESDRGQEGEDEDELEP